MASLLDALMAQERLGLQEDRLAMQMDRYAQQDANAAMKQRLAAMQATAGMYGPARAHAGGDYIDQRQAAMQTEMNNRSRRDIADQMYASMNGGRIPGATYHNSLLDRGEFWQGVHETNYANRLAEQDTQQAQQQMGLQYKDALAMEYAKQKAAQRDQMLKAFSERYRVAPGIALQPFDQATGSGYDVASGIATIPGTQRYDPETGGYIQSPPQKIRIPRVERDAYWNLFANEFGFPDERAMQAADPRNRELAELAELEKRAAAEAQGGGFNTPDLSNLQRDIQTARAFNQLFPGMREQQASQPDETQRKRMAQEAAARQAAERRKRERDEFASFEQQFRAANPFR